MDLQHVLEVFQERITNKLTAKDLLEVSKLSASAHFVSKKQPVFSLSFKFAAYQPETMVYRENTPHINMCI